MQKIVQRMRKELALPAYFTLDACRHGGLTELEEAELTDGQGRALSAHRTQESYEGYAKRNLPRALSATRKRYAHVLANASEQSVRMSPWRAVRMKIRTIQEVLDFVSENLAGAGGFEPPYGGIKIHCLTTWRRPIKRSGKRRDQPSADSLRQRRSIEGVEPFQQARARNSG